MKQTAVELFIEQLEEKGNSWENVSIKRIQISIKVEDYLKLINQAKEMEKEQMCDFATAYTAQDQHKISAKDYYNETFNTKER